jgi:hypothetical protein
MISAPLPSALLICALALSDTVAASQSLKMTRNIRSVSSMKNVTGKDRTRLKSFGETSTLLGVVPALNEDVSYTVEV